MPKTWAPIVHSDIKDANIFLRSNNTKYPAYPDVVVSDFDVSFEAEDAREADSRRYQGTPGMQSPERENIAIALDDWVAAQWSISGKSDVWSMGMTAWALMVAHKDKDFYEDARKISDKSTSNEELRKGKVGRKDGIFPTLLKELPEEYSVRLCALVSVCLRYKLNGRPSLKILRKKIDDNLSTLDRMYGDEIHKAKDAIADEFKLKFTTKDSDEWALYAPGKSFVPPRKRRKTENSGAYDGKLLDLVTNWANETKYSQSSPAGRDYVLDLVNGIINGSPKAHIKTFREHKPHLIAWRSFFSSIRKRISSEGAVYKTVKNTEEVLRELFKVDTRRRVLTTPRDTIVPLAIENAESDSREGAANGTEMKSLETLKHTIEWNLVLLDIGAEPMTPRLSGKPEMHRGMIDFLFVQPFDLFPPDQPEAGEADGDEVNGDENG